MLLQTSQKGPLLIVLEKGDSLIEKLTSIIVEYKIPGGHLSGIGALKEVELGYYSLNNKSYIHKIFAEEEYELITLNGNISLKNNQPYVHAHVILGKDDFSTFGGHLFAAKVAATAEITIIPFEKMPVRQPNSAIGLDLICGFKN